MDVRSKKKLPRCTKQCREIDPKWHENHFKMRGVHWSTAHGIVLKCQPLARPQTTVQFIAPGLLASRKSRGRVQRHLPPFSNQQMLRAYRRCSWCLFRYATSEARFPVPIWLQNISNIYSYIMYAKNIFPSKPWRIKLIWIVFKYAVHTAQQTHSVSVIKTSQLVLCREIIDVFFLRAIRDA